MKNDNSPIKVGALFSSTGVTAVVEQTQLNAVRLAVGEVNRAGGVLGRELQLVEQNPESNPKLFQQMAELLLTQNKVTTIFGCYMSSTRKAVLPTIEKHGGLLFYPTLYEGFEFSENCVYSGCAPNQNIIPLARYLLNTFGNRFYLVGSNYVYPYETNRIMRDFIVSSGGKVLEERYLPLLPAEGDVQAILSDIKKHEGAVIVSTIVGDGMTDFYKGYRKEGFEPEQMPIASLTTGEPEIAAMGAEAAEGHISSAPYFQSIDTAANLTFTNEYGNLYGSDAPISACTEAAYLQVHLFAKAAELSGSIEPEKIKSGLNSVQYAAPQGAVRVDSQNSHTYLWPRIGKVDARGQFEVLEDTSSAVKPDPYLIDPGEQSWASSEPSVQNRVR